MCDVMIQAEILARAWEILETRLSEAVEATCESITVQCLDVDRSVSLLETKTLVLRVVPKSCAYHEPISMTAFDRALADAHEELSKALLGKEFLP